MNGECRCQANSSRLTPQTSDTGANPPDVPPRAWWVNPRCPRFGVSFSPCPFSGPIFLVSLFHCVLFVPISLLMWYHGGKGGCPAFDDDTVGTQESLIKATVASKNVSLVFGWFSFLSSSGREGSRSHAEASRTPLPSAPSACTPQGGIVALPCPALPCSASSTATTVN